MSKRSNLLVALATQNGKPPCKIEKTIETQGKTPCHLLSTLSSTSHTDSLLTRASLTKKWVENIQQDALSVSSEGPSLKSSVREYVKKKASTSHTDSLLTRTSLTEKWVENIQQDALSVTSEAPSLKSSVREYVKKNGYPWDNKISEVPLRPVATLVNYSSSDSISSCSSTDAGTPAKAAFQTPTSVLPDAPHVSQTTSETKEISTPAVPYIVFVTPAPVLRPPVLLDAENIAVQNTFQTKGSLIDDSKEVSPSVASNSPPGPYKINQVFNNFNHPGNLQERDLCQEAVSSVQESENSQKYKRKLSFETPLQTSTREAQRLEDAGNAPKKRQKVVMKDTGSFLPTFYLEDLSSTESDRSSDCGIVEDSGSKTVNDDTNSKNDQNDTPSTSSAQESTPLGSSSSNPSTLKSKRNCKPLKNCRRRLHEESEKSKRTKAYHAGVEYETAAGKPKEPRTMGAGCKDSCRKCENPRILQEDREKHFNEFWSLGTSEKKWDYLSRLVTRYEPKTCNTLPESAKKFIKVYKLKSNGTLVKVCKPTFLQTFGINCSWVDTALRKVHEKGSITPERRGVTGVCPNRATDPQKDSVRQHIEQIEKVPAHYTRARTRKQYYFGAGLSFERLYKMYEEWVEDKKLPAQNLATKSTYHEIFMTEYNIGFHEPLSDQCLVHARWKNGTVEEKRGMLDEYTRHLNGYNFVKKTKSEEKEYATTHDNFCLACFDLEKVLSVPRSSISIMFYLTKLSMYNFTVFELNSKRGFCSLWNETIAHRGANEIASNMLRFIEKMAAEGKTSFVLYSDSPTGQNKNRMVFSLWLYAAIRYRIDIVHRFFESGHSFSEVDSMHGNIERESTKKEIFHPDQWVELILSSMQNQQNYEIDYLTQENCFDFHKLVDELYWKKNKNGQTINWTLVKEVRATNLHPDTIFFKYGYEEEEQSVFVNPAENNFDITSYEFNQAVNEPIPLSQKKVADLTSLLTRNIIPAQFRDFYRNLPGMGSAK